MVCILYFPHGWVSDETLISRFTGPTRISKNPGRHSGKTHSDFKTKSRLGRVKRVVVIEGDMDFFGLFGEIADARRDAGYLIIRVIIVETLGDAFASDVAALVAPMQAKVGEPRLVTRFSDCITVKCSLSGASTRTSGSRLL